MGLLAAAEKIRAEMVISAKDDASKQIKPVTGELKKAFDALSKLMDKFKDLNKIDTAQLQGSLRNIESSVSGLAGSLKSMEATKPKVYVAKAGDSHTFIGDASSYKQEDLNENLRAQNRKIEASAKKLEKEVQNYDTILDTEIRTANAKYNNSIARQKSADAYTIKANASKGWWEYRSKHPEKFSPLRLQARYQTGDALSDVGEQIKNFGLGGFVGGSVLNVLGHGIALGPVAGIGAAFTAATEGAIKFAKASTEAYGQIESVKTQLSVVFGNEAQSSQMFSDISQYAVKSPFGIEETSELAVLLRQSGVYASDLLDTLKMIGDTAGGNMDKMKRIANNYAQIVSIGKASMLDMRQFAYAGIPIFKEVSDYLGVSQSRLRSMISDGKITAEIIENVFKNMTGAGGIFENATEKGARTFKARQQNLKDTKQLALSSAGEMLTRWGSDKHGNNSFAMSFLNFSESFYQALQKWADFKNLSKDVREINARQEKTLGLENNEEGAAPDDKSSMIESYKADLQKYKGLLDRANKKAVSAKNVGNEDWTQFWLSEAANIEKKVNRLNEILKEFGKISEEEDTKLVKYFDEAKARNEKIKEARLKIGLPDKVIEGERWEVNSAYISSRKSLRGSGYLAGLLTENVGKLFGDEYVRNAGETFKKEMGDSLILWATAASNFAEELDEADIAIRRSRLYVVNSEQRFGEQIDKNLRGENSIASVTNEIKAHNESQPSYKEKQEQEQRSLWERTIKVLEEINGKTDKEGYLKMPNVKKEDFLEWFKQGGIEGEKLVTTGYSGENILTRSNVRALSSNFEWAYPSLESMLFTKDKNGSYIFTEKQRNNLQSGLDSYKHAILDIKNADSDDDSTVLADKFDKGYKKLDESFERWIDSTPLEDTKELLRKMQTIFKATGFRWRPVSENLEIVDDEKEEKPKKEKELPEYIDLWKRILEQVTGIKAEYIKTGVQFMTMYRPEVARGIAQGGINGLVSDGASFSEIGNRMVYSDKKNAQGVYQIDWNKTAQNSVKEALSMEHGLEETTFTLRGLSDAIEGQKSGLNKLKQTVYTVGEDWGTIDQILKEKMVGKSLAEIDRLDNAFQSMSPESNEYKLGWDNEKGIVVINKATGQLVGALEEVKDDVNFAGTNVKEFADKVNKDNVIQALDVMDKNLRSLENVVNAHKVVVEEANSLAKQTAQTRAQTISGSYRTMGIARKILGYDNIAAAPQKTPAPRRLGLGEFMATSNPNMFNILTKMNLEAAVKNEEGKNPAAQGQREEEKSDLRKIVYYLITTGKTVEDYIRETGMPQDQIESFMEQWDKRYESSNTRLDALRKELQASNFVNQDIFGTTFMASLANRRQEPQKEETSTLQKKAVGFTTLSNGEKDYEVGKYFSASLSKFLEYVAGIDTKTSYEENKDILSLYGIGEDRYAALIKGAEALQSGEDEETAVESLLSEFSDVLKELINKAKDTVAANEAAEAVKSSDEFFNKGLYRGSISLRGRFMNSLMGSNSRLGTFVSAWDKNKRQDEASAAQTGLSEMTKTAFVNKDQNQEMLGLYASRAEKALEGTKWAGSSKDVASLIRNGYMDAAETTFNEMADNAGLGIDFKDLTDGANEWADSLGKISDAMADMAVNGAELVAQFALSAFTSTFSTMGESLATGADASKDLADNFKNLGAGLLSNLGTMITEAGLSMIINSGGQKHLIYAGLAMAAAGGAMSFLGGYYGADDDDDDKEEDEYQRLQAIKEDLADLLKQAREDSIYYENTVRHKNAISASEGFKTQKVNDAIITPSGNVISTAPDDYLIATKTPGTLGGGGAAPTVNFSVIDRSTGIKVTQQNTYYDKGTNTFDFEAVIESKVQEIIATSKGDDAFEARQARLNGKTVIM